MYGSNPNVHWQMVGKEGVYIYIYIYTHTHTLPSNTVEYYSAIKRMKYCYLQQHEWTWGTLCKWNKSDKAHTVWHHLYVTSKKYNKLVNEKRSRLIDILNKLVVASGERDEGRLQYGSWGGGEELLWDYMKSCVWNFWKLWGTIEFN